jgi:hypothetical protein
MGLTKDEFFSLTPRLFSAFRKQFLTARREVHVMLSILRADIINFSAARPRERITLDDLLPPDPEDRAPAPRRPRLTSQRRAVIAEGIRHLFPSVIVKQPETKDG